MISCDYEIVRGELTNVQINETLSLHNAEHSADDWIETIMAWQDKCQQMQIRIDEMESALRGAVIMQQGLDVPPGGGSGLVLPGKPKHGDVVDFGDGVIGQKAGQRLPDNVAKELGLPTRKDHEKRRRRGR